MNNHSAFLIDDLHLGIKFNFSLLTIVAADRHKNILGETAASSNSYSIFKINAKHC